ncbi:MAG: lytic transglycosylase domain-containing protein [Gammaproteobacteria bacterium]|nr:lytic transglycosylase domain-containing protein [Gammaproteobacteria bacterium]
MNVNTASLRTLILFCLLAVYATAGAEEFIPPVIDDEMRQALRQVMYGPEGFEDHIAAEVWLTDMSNRLKKTIPNADYRLQLLKTIHAESVRAGLEPELVLSVIQVESNFDRFALSPTGARGLMQIMPFWIKELGHPDDNLFIAQINLRYGTTILKYYLDKEKGQTSKALARYNGSVGKTNYPRRVYAAQRKKWFRQ